MTRNVVAVVSVVVVVLVVLLEELLLEVEVEVLVDADVLVVVVVVDIVGATVVSVGPTNVSQPTTNNPKKIIATKPSPEDFFQFIVSSYPK